MSGVTKCCESCHYCMGIIGSDWSVCMHDFPDDRYARLVIGDQDGFDCDDFTPKED